MFNIIILGLVNLDDVGLIIYFNFLLINLNVFFGLRGMVGNVRIDNSVVLVDIDVFSNFIVIIG